MIDFSVIVTVYNIKYFLQECVESILDQKAKSIEILLVDDGSNDGSENLCDQLASENKSINVIHKANGGPSSARNTGIRCSKGKYIIFVDGDDMLKKDSLLGIKNFIGDTESDVILGRYQDYNYKTGTVDAPHFAYNPQVIELGEPWEIVKHVLCDTYKAYWSVCKNIYLRSFLIKHKLYFNESVLFAEDAEWTLRMLLAAHSFCYYPPPFYLYRIQRPESLMTKRNINKEEYFFDVLQIWESTAENIDNKDLKKAILKRMSQAYADSCFTSMLQFNPKLRYELTTKIKKKLYWLSYGNCKKTCILNLFSHIFGYEVTIHIISAFNTIRQIGGNMY